MRFAGESVNIAKTQEELQDMMNRFVDSRSQCGIEIIAKSQVMRVSRRNASLWIKVSNRELKEVDHYKYFGNVLTRDGYCIREIKMRIAIAEEEFNRKNITLDKQKEIG